MITIKLNGSTMTFLRGSMLADVLRRLDLPPDAAGVAVAVNSVVLPRARWTEHSMQDGDTVEVIQAVQGG